MRKNFLAVLVLLLLNQIALAQGLSAGVSNSQELFSKPTVPVEVNHAQVIPDANATKNEYSSIGDPKAFGLKFKFKYPKEWTVLNTEPQSAIVVVGEAENDKPTKTFLIVNTTDLMGRANLSTANQEMIYQLAANDTEELKNTFHLDKVFGVNLIEEEIESGQTIHGLLFGGTKRRINTKGNAVINNVTVFVFNLDGYYLYFLHNTFCMEAKQDAYINSPKYKQNMLGLAEVVKSIEIY